MKHIIALVLLVGGCRMSFSQALPAQTQEALVVNKSISVQEVLPTGRSIRVKVIDNVPIDNNYDWNVSGSSSVSCRGNYCVAYYNPPSAGTATVGGAILRLLLPDNRIVIASCAMKPDNAENFSNAFAALGGQYASTVYRDCHIPTPYDEVVAKFKGDNVKLSMQTISIDGRGKKYSEIYAIRGVLQPSR